MSGMWALGGDFITSLLRSWISFVCGVDFCSSPSFELSDLRLPFFSLPLRETGGGSTSSGGLGLAALSVLSQSFSCSFAECRPFSLALGGSFTGGFGGGDSGDLECLLGVVLLSSLSIPFPFLGTLDLSLFFSRSFPRSFSLLFSFLTFFTSVLHVQ